MANTAASVFTFSVRLNCLLYCAHTLTLGFQDERKGIDVTFTDLCLSCANSFNISLSHQAFAQIAPLELGQIYPVDWTFFPN